MLNRWPGWKAAPHVGAAVVEGFQGTRREKLSRRATGWMAATAKGAAEFLGTKRGGR